MSEHIHNQYAPDVVSAPGETLAEILDAKGMSQAELAERTGRPKKTINEIIKGKTAITAETTLQLERVLGIPAAFWMAREHHYREALARAKEAVELEEQIGWLEQIPYKAMTKLGWIAEHREKKHIIDELLRFFAVASPSTWEDLWRGTEPAFRRSAAFQASPGAIAAWLRQGEIEASSREVTEYNAELFKAVLGRIRSLTQRLPRDFASIVIDDCASAGVNVVFVPELAGTRVWGATRWLTPNRAVIQLSLRYKTDDHLWFTFFHEAGHILLHGRREIFVEDEDGDRSAKEAEADAFARDWLIPPHRYRTFCRQGAFTCAAASRFAFELGITAGIVIGRLQHDGFLDRSHCNQLKKKVDWVNQ
jgi:addiction module HigA family antidote